jgi:hypothetical protein
MTARPALDDCSTGAELDRWYWTREELVTTARARRLPTTGSKDRLARSTVLPPGQRCTQRCTQQLRHFCVAELGPRFHFDALLRTLVAASDGTGTLGDLLERWQRTRRTTATAIAPQFELNRFLRRWHLEHPGGGRRAALDAWR